MDSLRHFPLGSRFPDSPHAVVSSLPTMADVRGYEEKEPRVVNSMSSGYPRFVVHAYVAQLMELYFRRAGLDASAGVLVVDVRFARDLLEYVGGGAEVLEVDDGLQLVYCEKGDTQLVRKIGKYVQHVGCGISSRCAEDLLVRCGRMSGVHREAVFEGGEAGAEVEGRLAELFECPEADVQVCASGMNAFYAAFRAVRELQHSRGRRHWLQLGWLYVDSGCILKEFLGDGAVLDHCYDVTDTDALLEKISSLGNTLAAVVVECPTNPLVRVCDLKRVSQAVRAGGGVLIVDPSVASIYNVNVLPYADVVVNSLTKYASNEGDVMVGSLALNAASPCYGELAAGIADFCAPPYCRDMQRLAFEMQDATEVVVQINRNAVRLAGFLRQHPAVETVYYAPDSVHYADIAKDVSCTGALVSMVLKGSMERFYDKLAAMKGPSFGTRFTLLSPFMYLAHYGLVSNAEGRAFLRDIGIAPDLIRLSVGTERYEAIEAIFEEALQASIVV